MTQMTPTIIGVAGGTGSGKTTLALKLREAFDPKDVIILSHDHYYKEHSEMTFEERCKLNYDHPDAFDTALMVEQLQQLRRGESIHRPQYSFSDHNRMPETVLVHPARVIIVEGILIFENKALCDLMDMKIFVDTDADVPLHPAAAAGRQVPGTQRGIGGGAVSADGQAHARPVRGAQPPQRRYHRPRRRHEPGGPQRPHRPHPGHHQPKITANQAPGKKSGGFFFWTNYKRILLFSGRVRDRRKREASSRK